jgi:chromosome segregation ATPase
MLKMSPRMALPEADINDESGGDLFLYSGAASEPDPFSANANTYYTPQVNIPVTPPKGVPRHLRTTSKEENFIMSLQTELALKTELCAQYEADLKARDELVEILGKKLGDVEKDEGKRKAAVRGWRKKVQEMERNCRMLEEAMDRSRQESVERSVMDEASGEALRMLHRQIQGLESEKGEWALREEKLKEELEELERAVRDRNEDLDEMKERLMRGDERERELKEGLREAKEQIEMMGDCSIVIGGVDELEMEREREQKESQETQRFRMKELELVQELEEMKAKIEWLEVEKRGLEEQVEGLTLQLGTKEEEGKVLKGEVEAQWERTERMGERAGELEREKEELVTERDALRGDVESLEEQIGSLENEWREGEERRNDLEEEVREVRRTKDNLEQERLKVSDIFNIDIIESYRWF